MKKSHQKTWLTLLKAQLVKYNFIGLLALLLINTNIAAQTKADDIIGMWLTPGKDPAKVEVFKSGDKYYGKMLTVLVC